MLVLGQRLPSFPYLMGLINMITCFIKLCKSTGLWRELAGKLNAVLFNLITEVTLYLLFFI